MKNIFTAFVFLLLLNCNNEKSTKAESSNDVEVTQEEIPNLNLEQANRLVDLPLACVGTEFPYRLGQTLGSVDDLKTPRELHPTFYGCFDWHSAVHGHWSLVSLLRQFPGLKRADEIEAWLLNSISKENILKEVAYFDDKNNKNFERTYGWAWVLKLAEEIHIWDNDIARELEGNLQPLTDLIVDKYLEFLPKLNYPLRVGEHPNTAFGLTFAFDYAVRLKNEQLKSMIEKRARDFYKSDDSCPLSWEPSGSDFLSPCFEEAAIMKRVLPIDEFKTWFEAFIPEAKNKNFDIVVGEVSDRTDGKLVHLDGVNFSRAWSLNYIAKDLPEYSHLKNLANKHINYSLPSIVGDSYEGGHWLGSFAIYALNSIE
ncbi:hypothetical protein BTO05_03800 [Winogradskyella sp. PC-19]|uniref:DUF2891 domain-containing protein n=1 Tax=unclassified Winogradskyella TaxID=2615021 RepID=UPI000B3D0220|nr:MULTISPECIES: DUF2891 domain-containing protein [unclassified Winogradskyella]ARV08803.1 hypothetical protein BTO05_03800 [Winogradskyella sp. PC-19]RZN75018.1 MAG: DUF2891 domain-containing protein [Winogradskyella sp.]